MLISRSPLLEGGAEAASPQVHGDDSRLLRLHVGGGELCPLRPPYLAGNAPRSHSWSTRCDETCQGGDDGD